RKEVIALLEKAKALAANQTSDNLGECVSLISLLEAADGGERDDLRRRGRGGSPRVGDSVWGLIGPPGPVRLCALQNRFAGGERCRNYLLYYRPPESNFGGRKEEQRYVGSLANVVKPRDLDLRRHGDVTKLEARLTAINLEDLQALLA